MYDLLTKEVKQTVHTRNYENRRLYYVNNKILFYLVTYAVWQVQVVLRLRNPIITLLLSWSKRKQSTQKRNIYICSEHIVSP